MGVCLAERGVRSMRVASGLLLSLQPPSDIVFILDAVASCEAGVAYPALVPVPGLLPFPCPFPLFPFIFILIFVEIDEDEDLSSLTLSVDANLTS